MNTLPNKYLVKFNSNEEGNEIIQAISPLQTKISVKWYGIQVVNGKAQRVDKNANKYDSSLPEISFSTWKELFYALPEHWYINPKTKEEVKLVGEFYNKMLKQTIYTRNDNFKVFYNSHNDDGISVLSPEFSLNLTFLGKRLNGVEINIEQFKKIIEMSTKKVLGYKLKPECEKFKPILYASLKITLGPNGEVPTSKIYELGVLNVLDEWFDPIYKPALPVIADIQGEINGNVINYGCQSFTVEQVSDLYFSLSQIKQQGLNIKGISLKLDIIREITFSQIEELYKAIND